MESWHTTDISQGLSSCMVDHKNVDNFSAVRVNASSSLYCTDTADGQKGSQLAMNIISAGNDPN